MSAGLSRAAWRLKSRSFNGPTMKAPSDGSPLSCIGTLRVRDEGLHFPSSQTAQLRASKVMRPFPLSPAVCERRRAKALRNATEGAEHPGGQGGGGEQFTDSNAAKFAESNYSSPQFKMRFVRLPLGRPGAVYAMQQVNQTSNFDDIRLPAFHCL